MTRKHFILIAQALSSCHDFLSPAQLDVLAHRVANVLAATNPNFDHERFIRAATRGD